MSLFLYFYPIYISAPGSGVAALPGFLADPGVDAGDCEGPGRLDRRAQGSDPEEASLVATCGAEGREAADGKARREVLLESQTEI